MASFRAIAITSSALRGLLDNAHPGEADGFAGAQFKVCQPAQLQAAPFDLGVSIYLYRVAFNTSRRSLPPRQTPDGRTFRPSTPVDLHYLFTAWAKSAERQHALLGWVIRTLQDTPVLPAGVLNSFAGDGPGFLNDENVELTGELLSLQDMENIWEIAPTNQQPSVSYLARMILIDSEVETPQPARVQTRGLDAAILTA